MVIAQQHAQQPIIIQMELHVFHAQLAVYNAQAEQIVYLGAVQHHFHTILMVSVMHNVLATHILILKIIVNYVLLIIQIAQNVMQMNA